MRLRNFFGGLHDETSYELHAILEDFWFARDLLRRVGDKERARFEEAGWAWGDPSIYGGDAVELWEHQLNTVLKTLGFSVRGTLFFELHPEHQEPTLAPQMIRENGRPVDTEELFPSPWIEEIFVAELSGSQSSWRRCGGT